MSVTMHQNSDTIQSTLAYSKHNITAISLLTLLYVVTSFGLVGIPGVSRLALYSAALLFLIVIFNQLRISTWTILALFFCAFITIPSLALEKPSYEMLGKVIAAFIGTISIGLGLQNKILSYKVIVYGALIAAILNIFAVAMGIDTAPIAEKGRYSGLMGNPNALSISMALAGFLVWLFPDRFSWFIKLLATFVTLYGVYISGSRKGLLLAGTLVLLIFVDKLAHLSKIKRLLYGSGVIVAVTAFYALLVQMVTTHSISIVAVDRLLRGLAGQDTSYKGRVSLIEAGIKLWKESPVWGHGLDQFASLSGFGAYAHNNYIELAVSGGTIALILFYSIHIIILMNALKQPTVLRLRLIFFLLAILLMDAAMVSFYDKAVMCTLGTLLAVTSASNKQRLPKESKSKMTKESVIRV